MKTRAYGTAANIYLAARVSVETTSYGAAGDIYNAARECVEGIAYGTSTDIHLTVDGAGSPTKTAAFNI